MSNNFRDSMYDDNSPINKVFKHEQDIEGINTSLEQRPAPRPIIWDTDWWTDVDDVVAARILLWAERAGMIDIVGVTANTNKYNIIPSLDAFFEAEGRPNMTMAVDHAATDFNGTPPYQDNMLQHRHSYSGSATTESAVRFYRRALSQSTEKIDIIAVGYLNNLSNLLQSPPDDISQYTGKELVTQKVNHLWVMAGEFPSGSENNFTRTVRSRSAGAYVCANWTTDITFLGYSVGSTVVSGDTLATVSPAADDLLTKALADHGSATGRSSWDPMLTLMACYGDPESAGYKTVRGTISVDPATGSNTFTVNENGKHRYVVKVRTDNWYKLAINNIIEKRSWFGRTNIGVKQLPKPDRLAEVVDKDSLVGYWAAADLVGTPDTTLVYHIEDRMSKNHLRAVTAERPAFVGSKNGKPALQFDGTKRMVTDISALGTDFTVYTKVLWDTLPVANQSVMAQDDGGVRLWHLKAASATQVQAARFTGSTGLTDLQNGTLVAGTWHVLTAKFTATTIEVFIDGVSNGTSPITNPNVNGIGIVLGNRNTSGALSEGFVGFLTEARIYTDAHDSNTIAAVIAEMA